MTRTVVGVLRGGTSSEYDLSLKTGARILNELPEDRYETRDIFIDRRGIWHLRGMPVQPVRSLQQVDVVLNAIHGGMGEDGTIQRFLESAGVPYAGTRAPAASASLNKIRAHEILEAAGIRMPSAAAFSLKDTLDTAEMAREVFQFFGPPYVVKPPREGASIGIRIVPSINDLPDALGDVLDAYGSVLVERFIAGEQISAGVIENFRKQKLYVLPPAHSRILDGSQSIESRHHLEAGIEHIVPSRFSDTEKKQIAEIARAAHKALGMEHFSRADLIRTPKAMYLLEVNAIPGLYAGASFPPMLESVGSSVTQFLEHAIELARMRR